MRVCERSLRLAPGEERCDMFRQLSLTSNKENRKFWRGELNNRDLRIQMEQNKVELLGGQSTMPDSTPPLRKVKHEGRAAQEGFPHLCHTNRPGEKTKRRRAHYLTGVK